LRVGGFHKTEYLPKEKEIELVVFIRIKQIIFLER